MNNTFRKLRLAQAAIIAAGFMAAAPAHAGFQWTAPAAGSLTVPTSPVGTMAPNRPFEAAPRAAAAPVSPVMSESLPNSLGTISRSGPIATTPDGPANAAPIYGKGMTNDPITWNPSHNAQGNAMGGNAMGGARAPQGMNAAEVVPLGQPMALTSAPLLGPTLGAPAAPQQATSAPVTGTPMMQPASVGNYGSGNYGAGNYAVAEGFGRDLPLVMAIRQIVPAQYGFVFDQGIDVSNNVSWQGGQPWDIVLQNTLAPLGMQATIRGNVVTISRPGNMGSASVPGMQPYGAQVSTNIMQASASNTMAPPVMQPAMVSPSMQPAMISPGTGNMSSSPVPGMDAVVDDMSGTTGYYNAASAPSATDLNATITWSAARNSTLRTILEDWSKRVGVELYWASEYDYPIQSAVSIDGTFEDAVQTLLKGLTDSKPRPLGRLHPNLPNGPAVLVIETRQNSM